MKLSIQVNDCRCYEVLAAFDNHSASFGFSLDSGPSVQTGFATEREAVKAAIEDIFCLEGAT